MREPHQAAQREAQQPISEIADCGGGAATCQVDRSEPQVSCATTAEPAAAGEAEAHPQTRVQIKPEANQFTEYEQLNQNV